MSTPIETRTDAWERRAALRGDVDFTMMYIAHDAFNRDIARLTAAAEAGDGLSPAAEATWHGFAKQLHTHHSAEDDALWPGLRTAVTDPAEIRVLDDMEAEHATIDPLLEEIDKAYADRDATALSGALRTLGAGLAAHMIHEETDALPLLERRAGQHGWDAFTHEIRSQQGGIKGAAEYLPWVLEGADADAEARLLRLLPAPARVLYRRVWAPRYRRSNRLR